MSDYFRVTFSAGDYGVSIGQDLLKDALLDGSHDIFLCDSYFAENFRSQGADVISIDATESSKTLEHMTDIVLQLRMQGANRNTRLFAVGGGIIQDIATFCASIYMRGVKWDYAPTTLLGMVDSCIGGKSSINVGKYKNLVGNFYPPEEIYIDLSFIETLNSEQRVAGLCEAVKICFAHGDEALNAFLELRPEPHSPIAVYQRLINLTLQSKRWFIEIDEHDKKERLLLNYGHTFAHAIEAASDYAIPHGVAVGLGMIAAIEFSRKHFKPSAVPARTALLEAYLRDLLGTVDRLPAWLDRIVVAELIDRFNADKKHTGDRYTLIVPDEDGNLVRLQVEKSEANREQILAAFQFACDFTSV